jgi:hypothetical protein
MTRGLFVISAAFFALAAGTHLLSYTPLGQADVLQATSMLAFPVLFPVWAVMLFAIFLGRVPFDRVLSSLPMPVKVLGVLLVAYVFVDFFLMAVLLPGQPVAQGGSFFFDDHGLVPTTEAAYRQGLAYQARLISGHEMLLFGLAAAFGYQLERLRSGKAHLGVAPIPAIGDVFSPWPLDRLVQLETALTPDQCATRLDARMGPVLGRSWGGHLELWGSVSSEGFSLQLFRGSSSSQLVFAIGRFARMGPATRVEVWLQLKRWAVLAVGGTAVALPIIGVVTNVITGGSHYSLALLSAIAVFGLVGNLAFAFFQRHRLLSFIERTLDARRIQMPPPT